MIKNVPYEQQGNKAKKRDRKAAMGRTKGAPNVKSSCVRDIKYGIIVVETQRLHGNQVNPFFSPG